MKIGIGQRVRCKTGEKVTTAECGTVTEIDRYVKNLGKVTWDDGSPTSQKEESLEMYVPETVGEGVHLPYGWNWDTEQPGTKPGTVERPWQLGPDLTKMRDPDRDSAGYKV